MNRKGKLLVMSGLCVASFVFQSCLDDNDGSLSYGFPTAVVTVCPGEDESFVMNLDDSTVLRATNLKSSPFGRKEVRALVNYSADDDGRMGKDVRNVKVNWIDSIRTKTPVVSTEKDAELYGDDPIEVVRDWVTVAEDGYLTLRVRTNWGSPSIPHAINLVTGINADNPMEMELRHDAGGDLSGTSGDALIAFDLNGISEFKDKDKVRIKLNWKSFSGMKFHEFDLRMRVKE